MENGPRHPLESSVLGSSASSVFGSLGVGGSGFCIISCCCDTKHGTIMMGLCYGDCRLVGFAFQDAVALLRLDDLYVDSFQVQDVKTLTGDHLR